MSPPPTNKSDLIGVEERRRLEASDPAVVVLSARTGDGRDELLERVAARLALDVRRVTLVFDAKEKRDRRAVASVYRDGRVISHLETDERITLEAEVPRRVIERLSLAADEVES